jgi:hypothetical protein
MATYYVDFATGVDTNNGTSTETPWEHCPGDVNATNNAAITLSVGDIIYFKGGISYVGKISTNANGTALAYIQYLSGDLVSWGTGRGKIDSGNTLIHGFFISHAYLRFKGLEVCNVAYTADSSSAFFLNSGGSPSYIEIQENYIHDIPRAPGNSDTGYGVEIDAGHHILVEKNIIEDCGEKAIEATYNCTYVTIRYNYISGGYSHSIVISGQHCDTYNNIITLNGSTETQAYGIKLDSGTNASEYNKVYNNIIYDCRCGIGILNGRLNEIYHNIVFYTSQGTRHTAEADAVGLSMYDDGTSAIDVENNKIYNNIFYYSGKMNGTDAVEMFFKSNIGNNNEVKNNIFYYDASDTDTLFRYNDGSYSYHDLTWFEGTNGFSAVGTGNIASGNRVSAPGFVGGTGATLFAVCPTGFAIDWTPNNDNLQLLVDSSAIDAGLALAADFNIDIDGIIRPRGADWDIGAYEYDSGITPTFKQGTRLRF